jgi:glycosyltransferase involved in cell wall biosynthesis
MLSDSDLVLGCASFGQTDSLRTSHHDRVDCFVIPKGGSRSEYNLEICRNLVTDWKPDLIHIHGTEEAYGLLTARKMVKCPAVISLQGLLGPSSEWYRYFGNRSMMDIIRMHRWLEIPAMRGHWLGFLKLRSKAKREREIISGNRLFMGRTEWDEAFVRALNPKAKYYHAGELLRNAFWQKRWNIANIRRHRIIFTNAHHPRKGTEVLLEATKLIAADYPDIQLSIAGNISHRSGYGRYLRHHLRRLGEACVELGPLNAEQMAEELIKAHVFIHPSFIDNSPNSVAEAQLLGMPVIATYTGGVPNLVEHGRTGLLSPTGDAFMLAARIRRVFEDDALAVRLGSQAHEAAVRRHDPRSITREIVETYKHILRTST